MKKFIKEHTTISIIIVSILLILLVALAIFLATRGKKTQNSGMGNTYQIVEEAVELPGTKIITNDDLKSKHCLNDVCVSDVTVYTTSKEGRIECTITNQTEEVKSGYLMLIFGDKELMVSYQNLGVSTKATSQFFGYSLEGASDYTLKIPTDKDLESLVK